MCNITKQSHESETPKGLVLPEKTFNPAERILQYGEGNFLRAFIGDFIDQLNVQGLTDAKITIIQPLPQGWADLINEQDGKYTLLLRGYENGELKVVKRQINSIICAIAPYEIETYKKYIKTMENPAMRFVFSNTTEAGIIFNEKDNFVDAPPVGFPAKITTLLMERYRHFDDDPTKGLIFIPCELIDNNGDKLKEIVLQHCTAWNLPEKFINWVKNYNYFLNTLVDRIVTGYPKEETEELAIIAKELGYEDKLVVAGEIFHFFAIEVKDEAIRKEIEETLPFQKAGINVILTNDVAPYKLRKVRILNGTHTMSVLAARLCGMETVGEMMQDSLFTKFLHKGIFDEIIPMLTLPREDLESFANSVFDRFSNPYIKHYLLSIALNSVAKFTTRVLPTILEYIQQKKEIPNSLTLSFAALLAFYNTEEANDDKSVITFFKEEWAKVNNSSNTVLEFVQTVFAKTDFWGQDLNGISGLKDKISDNLSGIIKNGMRSELEKLLGVEA